MGVVKKMSVLGTGSRPLKINSEGVFDTIKNLTINSDLTVLGSFIGGTDVTIGDDLHLVGNLIVDGNISSSGVTVQVNDNLHVIGSIVCNGNITNNKLILSGSTISSSDPIITIDNVLSLSNDLNVAGDIIGGGVISTSGIITNGNLTLSTNTISSSGAIVSINDDLQVTGSIYNGNLTLQGNEISSSGATVQISDNLNVVGTITSNNTITNGNLSFTTNTITSTGAIVRIDDDLSVTGTITSNGSILTNSNISAAGTIDNGDLILSTNQIASTLGATVVIADNLQVNGTLQGGNITINTDTISSSNATIIVNDNLNVLNTTILGSAISVPSNVGEGVIQLKSASDATYGNPTSSCLLYSDSNNKLSTKNTSGVKTCLSLPAFFYGTHINNGSNTVITTASTATKITHTLVTTLSSEFAYNTTTKLITYTGPNRLLSISGCITVFNTTVLQTGIISPCIVQNGTFNGSNEATAGTVHSGCRFNTNDTTNISGSIDILVNAATNDTFVFCIINHQNANDVQVIDANIIIKSYQTGSG